MNFQRLLNTKLGQFFISVLLGLGLATLFRRACTEKNCIHFNGPTINAFDDKIYKHEGKCYKYSASSAKCNKKTKKVLDITDEENEVESAQQSSLGLSFLGND
jgi:hypothetical protein